MALKIIARGQDTRQSLLDVATQLFSEKGFDGVSTRTIASTAGATLPSIAHHFGSKEGLYQAVLQDISTQLGNRLAGASTAAYAVLNRKDASRTEHLDALLSLLSNHAWVILYSRPEWARLMAQEQVHPSGASTPVNNALEQYLMEPLMQLVARLRGLLSHSDEVKLQAFFLVGRVLIFRSVRSSALNQMGWDEFTPDRIQSIINLLKTEVYLLFREG